MWRHLYLHDGSNYFSSCTCIKWWKYQNLKRLKRVLMRSFTHVLTDSTCTCLTNAYPPPPPTFSKDKPLVWNLYLIMEGIESCRGSGILRLSIASLTDVLLACHAIFLSPNSGWSLLTVGKVCARHFSRHLRWGGKLVGEPKKHLLGRLEYQRLLKGFYTLTLQLRLAKTEKPLCFSLSPNAPALPSDHVSLPVFKWPLLPLSPPGKVLSVSSCSLPFPFFPRYQFLLLPSLSIPETEFEYFFCRTHRSIGCGQHFLSYQSSPAGPTVKKSQSCFAYYNCLWFVQSSLINIQCPSKGLLLESILRSVIG